MIREFGLLWTVNPEKWDAAALKGRWKNYEANFSDQQGIYILYRDQNPMYVGLARKAGIGSRLQFHHRNKFKKYENESGKHWNQFSWFGLRSASLGEPCSLDELSDEQTLKVHSIIGDLEALLIAAFNLNNTMKPKLSDARRWTQVSQIAGG